MDENPENQTPNPEPESAAEAWQEVGRQVKTLGESLAAAFRSAWENEDNRKQIQELEAGLKSLVKDVDQAIQEKAGSPEGQKVQQEVLRAAESARAASKQAIDDVRPHLLSALRQVNTELQKFLDQAESGSTAAEAPKEPPAES